MRMGVVVAGFRVRVLLSLRNWMLVNVKSLSNRPPNYKIKIFGLKCLICIALLWLLGVTEIFLSCLFQREKSVCSSLGI